MKNKLHTVQPIKKEDEKLHTKVDYSKIPNKMHLEAQIKFPHLVQENKRKKKPKYRNNYYED